MRSKYEDLLEMINKVLNKLKENKATTEANYKFVQAEKIAVNKTIGDIESRMEEVDYILYVLNNYKEIVKDIVKEEILIPAIIIFVVVTGIMTLFTGAFTNPIMFLVSIVSSLGLTIFGSGIEYLIESSDIRSIKRKNVLEDVAGENLSLKQALKLKRSDLNNVCEAEKNIADMLKEINLDIKKHGEFATEIFDARLISQQKAKGDIDEMNKMFVLDHGTVEIMNLARKKLDDKQD